MAQFRRVKLQFEDAFKVSGFSFFQLDKNLPTAEGCGGPLLLLWRKFIVNFTNASWDSGFGACANYSFWRAKDQGP